MDRVAWASLAIIGYTLLALIRATDAPPLAYAAALPALGLVLLAARATRPADLALAAGTDGAELFGRARSALRLSLVALLVAVLGALAPDRSEGRLALACAATAAGWLGASALGALRGERGLATEHARPLRFRLARGLAVASGLAAIALVGGRALGLYDPPLPIAVDEAALSVAAMGALGSLAATAVVELERRRLELGVADRLRAFVPVAFTLVAIAVALAGLGLADAAVVFPLALATGALLAGVAAVSTAPETLSRATARSAVVGALTVLPAIGLAALARARPEHAAGAVVGAALVALLAAYAAKRLADRLAPRTEPWTAAFEAAQRAASQPDPHVALEQALALLRGLSPRRNEAPAIYFFDPPSVMWVDIAGYVQREAVSIPERLAEVAKGEVESVVQAAVLERVAVRRPDVRPLLSWFDDRALLAVALIFEHDTPIGMVGLPRGARGLPLSLAEVRALGLLARLLGGHIATSGKLDRSLARERATSADAAREREELARVREELARELGRNQALAETLRARAERVLYSPAARLAHEALLAAGAAGEPLALLAPPGIDPLPPLATYHLARADRRALIVRAGEDRALTDLELWRDPERSPFTAARGGTLALMDAQLLPRLVQAYVATVMAGGGDAPALVAVLPASVDLLLAKGRLDEHLADALTASVQLPPLAARSEDLRALALDRLTALGLRAKGAPIGIDRSALAALAEHAWPGNDLELEAVLIRAAAVCSGDAITREDLTLSGFRPA